MRIRIIVCLLVLCNCNLLAQTKTNASLESVTIFSNGAELNHVAKAQLNEGIDEVVIGNLSNSIDESSIQLGCNADVTIMSVTYRQEYLSEKNQTPEIKRLKDSLKTESAKLQSLTSQIQIYTNALTVLDENKRVGGDNTGLNVTELQKMVDYYISKNIEMKNLISNLEKQKTEQQELVTKLQYQVNEFSNLNKNSKGEIVVQVQSEKNTSAVFGLSYVSTSARWSPVYDIKVNSTNAPLKLIYKGNIAQWTGLDWKKVKLNLSTSNPSLSGSAPILSTWFLNYYQSNYGKMNDGYYQNKIQTMKPAAQNAYAFKDKEKTETVDEFTTISETAVNATFEIDLPYDIPSDSKTHSVAMKDYELKANYKYYTAPRVDKDAFLMAEISDWEKLNLVAGPANIIFDGTYVGKSVIDPNSTQDTLNLSLGRDKKIVVKREKLTDFCSSKVISGNKIQTVTYEIRVKNTRKESIQLLLKDQFPKSTSDEIKIELLESSSAMINEETNILTWKLDLQPGETKKVRVSFSVKYPKGKQIGNLF